MSRVSATSIMLYAFNVFMTPVMSDTSLAEYAGVTFGRFWMMASASLAFWNSLAHPPPP